MDDNIEINVQISSESEESSVDYAELFRRMQNNDSDLKYVHINAIEAYPVINANRDTFLAIMKENTTVTYASIELLPGKGRGLN